MIASSPSPTLRSSSHSSPSSLSLFSRPQYDNTCRTAVVQPVPNKARTNPQSPRKPSIAQKPSPRSPPSAPGPEVDWESRTRTSQRGQVQTRPTQMVDASTQYSPQGDPASSQDPLQSALNVVRPESGHEPPASAADLMTSQPESPENPQAPAIVPRTLDRLRPTNASSPASLSSSGAKRNTSDVTSLANQPPQALTPDTTTSSGVASDVEQLAKRPRASRSSVKLMPSQYEHCNPKDLAVLISSMLMELIRNNDNIPLRDGHLTRFHSRAPPTISVLDYLQRLTTHATLSPPILLSMVSYIDRLCALYPAFTISSLTVHRFLITAATVASKGLSDSFWTNKTYARVGGVKLQELALLELEFLWRVEWRIVPRPEVLNDYYRSLVDRNDGYEIDSTGHLDDFESVPAR